MRRISPRLLRGDSFGRPLWLFLVGGKGARSSAEVDYDSTILSGVASPNCGTEVKLAQVLDAGPEHVPAGVHERRDQALGVVEAGAHHRAPGGAGGDALAHDRQLEVREGLIPGDVRDVET